MPKNLKNTKPLVTAVVTTYDRLWEAKRAILSVNGQSYEKLEIIVVEDGSTSGIEKWFSQNNLSNIFYKRLKENHGLPFVRNVALHLAKGKYISFLDDDDEWKKNRIEILIDKIIELGEDKKRDFGVIHSSLETRFPGSRRFPKLLRAANNGILKEAIIKEGIQTISSSSMFSRQALLQAGGFDESLTSGIDHDIWMAVALKGFRCVVVEEPLVISYSRLNRFTMMNDIRSRLDGVNQFVKKWLPVFIDWYGDDRGEHRMRKYHVGVIGYLLGFKVANLDLKGIKECIRAIFEASDDKMYNFKIILKSIIRGLIRKVD